ncbi:MAG: hypothetical protein EOO63_12320 [Hymenobacter sp.]|nr:MAG: hypothetical protein EOO63_12320 [Hymenobacter sp.]
MSNEEIIAYWLTQGVKVTTFSRDVLADFGFQNLTAELLSIVGLPTDAAPYLSFAESSSDFKRISIAYQQGDEFAHFIKIGFDGAGNPLVINTKQDDCIQWLDHEDKFSAHYVNCSLEALTASLVLYNQFIQQLLATRGPDAYLDADFTDEQIADLKLALSKVDAQAVAKDGLWQDELTTLLANREYYRTQNTA